MKDIHAIFSNVSLSFLKQITLLNEIQDGFYLLNKTGMNAHI